MSSVIKGIEAYDTDLYNDANQEISTSLYQKEWNSLFFSKYYLERLKSLAIKGELKNSHFRSICWKVFLKCLPEDKKLWFDTIKLKRTQYEAILDKFDTNPRTADYLDISVNNPLSQSQQSLWNQYFQDIELKLTIEQDVVRTFPEIEFFQRKNVQQMMVNILFSYAREFPHISYKQGMHELLAPILFVLHYDLEAYLHSSEAENLDMDIHIMLNQNYVEHDAFFLFCQLMETVEDWYTSNDYLYEKYAKLITAEPFSQKANLFPANSLGRKLRRIFEKLLKQFDNDLFLRLEELEITPQIFGIRWLRLLFGREFSLHDLLIVWDAIFADSVTFDLVDYIFVGMLKSIRNLLLYDDYSSCLTHLMRFPNVVDVRYIISLALHLRDPDGFILPRGPQVLTNLQMKTDKNASNRGVSMLPGSMSIKSSNNVSANVSKNTEGRPKSLSIPFMSHLRPLILQESSNGSQAETCVNRKTEENLPHETLDQKNIVTPDEDTCDKSVSCPQSRDYFAFPRTSIRNVMESMNNFNQAVEFTENLGYLKDSCILPEVAYREMVPLVSAPVSAVKNLYLKEDSLSTKNSSLVSALKEEISELRSIQNCAAERINQHLEKLKEVIICQNLLHEDEIYLALAGLKRVHEVLIGTVSLSEIIEDDINPYSVITKDSKHSNLENHDDSKCSRHKQNFIPKNNSNCNIPVSSEDIISLNILNEESYVKQSKVDIQTVNCNVSNLQLLLPSKNNQDVNDQISESVVKELNKIKHSER